MKLERTIAPDFKAVGHIKLIRPERVDMGNGCKLFCFNSSDQDLVRIEWIFGNLRVDPPKPLLNVAVNTMLAEGTAKLPASQSGDQIDLDGAVSQVHDGYD